MIIDKVAASHFYKDDGDKNKQNWFLYEYANLLFSKIEGSPKLAYYRKKHSKDNIIAFCVYFSKRSRQSIANFLEGHKPKVVIEARYVYDFYPNESREQIQRLSKVAFDTWVEHTQMCANCPAQCLTDGFEITDMFDNLEKTGWPTI
jgi:hypothetical protein